MSNPVLWRRASGDMEIDIGKDEYAYRLRPYYYPAPVLRSNFSGYFDYWQGNGLAVSIVIACSPIFERHYPELITKQAFWFIKHLYDRTDAKEEGVMIQLSVDHRLRDMVMQYANACNYPEDLINWFEHDNSMSVYYAKTEAMLCDVFKDKERVLHMDANYLVGWHPTHRRLLVFNRIKSSWRHIWRQHIAVMSTLLHPATAKCPSPMKKGNWDDVKEEMAAFVGHTVDDETRYWFESDPVYFIPGRMWGLTRALLDNPDFQSEIREIVRITTCDEVGLQTYARKYGWQAYNVADLSICFDKYDVEPESMDDIIQNLHPYGESYFIHSEHTDDSNCAEFWLSLYQQ